MSKPIIFIGYRTDFGALVELATLMNRKVLGVMDDNFKEFGDFEGLPNLGSEYELKQNKKHLLEECEFFISSYHNGMQNKDNPSKTGSIIRAERIAYMEHLGAKFVTLYHPHRSWIDPTATVEPGCFLGTNTSVGSHVHLGAHSVLSYSVGVGHHSYIKKNMIAMPRALIGGGTKIGENCLFGINVSLMPGHWGDSITIGNNVMVHPGVIVMRDLPDNCLVGIHGKIMHDNDPLKLKNLISGFSGIVGGRG